MEKQTIYIITSYNYGAYVIESIWNNLEQAETEAQKIYENNGGVEKTYNKDIIQINEYLLNDSNEDNE